MEVSMELMHKEIADKRLAGKGEPPQTQGLARRCIHGAALNKSAVACRVLWNQLPGFVKD